MFFKSPPQTLAKAAPRFTKALAENISCMFVLNGSLLQKGPTKHKFLNWEKLGLFPGFVTFVCFRFVGHLVESPDWEEGASRKWVALSHLMWGGRSLILNIFRVTILNLKIYLGSGER